MSQLNTNNLVLRHYRAADEEAFTRLVTDGEVMARLSGPLTPQRARQKLALHCQFGQEKTFAWAAEHSGAYAGHLFLVWQEDLAGWELGYIIAPAFQRQGLGSEGARAILDWAKAQGHLPVLVTVDTDHQASQRVAERIGLTGPEELTDEEGPYYLYRSA